MTFNDLQKMFDRAFWHSFSKRRMFFVFIVLSLCGLLSVFCRGLAFQSGDWVAMSLTFLPVFLCTGILLSTGVVLIRCYHDEIKNRDASLRKIFKKSWSLILGTSYIAIPLLLCYLVLWILLGIFYLLKGIPSLGEFISVIFSFGPFLIILGSLVLVVFNLFLLFFATPAIGLNGEEDRLKVARVVLKRFKFDIFGNLVLVLMAITPLLIVVGLLLLSAILTEVSYTDPNNTLHIVLQWFFIMLPFAALLSPAVIFFFNFAAESHVFMQKKIREIEDYIG
jgi:hypothetical protein